MDSKTAECDQANKARWNELVGIHMKSRYYRVEEFKRGDIQSSLDAAVLEDLAPYIDLKGKSILHLQCHFGQDTISLVRLGAASVVGVDYSREAVKAATEMAKEIGYGPDRCRFICSNVLTLRECSELADQKFDLVFTNEGVICWLSDLKEWAKVIAHYMKPRTGVFYIFEFHPFANVLDSEANEEEGTAKEIKEAEEADDEDEELRPCYPYFPSSTPTEHISESTYTEHDGQLMNVKEYEWAHSMSEIIGVLLAERLTLKFLHEYPFSTYEQLPGVEEEEGSDDRFVFKDKKLRDSVPLMFSLLTTNE